MPLEFHEDAICLSGVLGTKLKSRIIRDYYDLWWKITSGGPRVNYGYYTTIIEMNAGTGEIYIKESDEIILGSAGYALELKFNNPYVENPDICVILVEEEEECIDHLKEVIKRRYPYADINENIEDLDLSVRDCVLIRKNVSEAIKTINELRIRGRVIYFFDPLLSVDMKPLRETYEKRIKYPFITGVEFIVFFFTSDWIYGRDDFTPLPDHLNSEIWTEEEFTVVQLLEDVYDDDEWYNVILTKEKFKENNVNTLYEEIFFKYQKRNIFYRGIIDQSFEDLSKYLGLTYSNKPHYYYSNDNEYFIKHTGSVHKFTRQSNQALPSPAVCFYDEGYTKIIIDDDNITIINNFLENLRNHWDTYYYKRILRKKLKPKLDFSNLLN